MNSHFVKVRNFRDVNQIDDGKVLDLLGDAVKAFIHFHASRVPIVTKTNHLKKRKSLE